MSAPRVRVSFVCLGNICRSPTAEAVMRHLVKRAGLDREIAIDSAGTGDWHVGEPRDRRSSEVGKRRGIPLAGRARQFVAADFDRFDYVIAMDRSNHANLLKLAPDAAARAKVRLLRSFDRDVRRPPGSVPAAAAADVDDEVRGDEVPDPYYGGPEGFDRVFDICLAACAGFLAHLCDAHGLTPRPDPA